MDERQTLADQHERVYQAIVELEQDQQAAREDEIAARAGMSPDDVRTVLGELVREKKLVTQLPPDPDADLGPRYATSDRPA